eukprot:757480-Hanusia_phi.AAC.1
MPSQKHHYALPELKYDQHYLNLKHARSTLPQKAQKSPPIVRGSPTPGSPSLLVEGPPPLPPAVSLPLVGPAGEDVRPEKPQDSIVSLPR